MNVKISYEYFTFSHSVWMLQYHEADDREVLSSK